MIVTREGIEEVGHNLFGDRRSPPLWILKSEPHDIPDWFPDDYEHLPSVVCHHCEQSFECTEVVAPGWADSDTDSEQYCSDCWEEIREDWRRDREPR